jgi:hypothetical protein
MLKVIIAMWYLARWYYMLVFSYLLLLGEEAWCISELGSYTSSRNLVAHRATHARQLSRSW